jgi:hemoglobin
MQGMRLTASVIGVALLIVGCASQEREVALLRDGELAVPNGYKSWPKFLSDIQRPDNKQVREIFVNSAGAKANRGDHFPNRTLFVMEIYKANATNDGKFEKGELAKIFVMGKNHR